MKCSKCGREVAADAKFCANCGQPAAEEERVYCDNCGSRMAVGDKFCAVCGTRTDSPASGSGASSLPTASRSQGQAGNRQAQGKRQLFAQKGHLKVDAAMAAERFLRNSKNMETQIVEQGDGLVVQAKQSANLLKSALGLDAAVTVKFTQEGSDLFAEFGAGKWLDKVAGAAVGWYLFWPAILTTGYGVYAQKNLLANLEDHVRNFLLNNH